MMDILNNIIIILTSVSVITGIISIVIAIWAIVTHREKYYKEKKDMFDLQIRKVNKDLEKRSRNDE